MYVDAQLLFSDAQAITADASSTNTIDLGAARNIGVGQALYIHTIVDVAMTDSGSNSTLQVYLWGDSTTSFTPDDTQLLFTIPAVTAAGQKFVGRIAPGFASNYRYIQLRYTPVNGDLSAGSFTSFVSVDSDVNTVFADGITIT